MLFSLNLEKKTLNTTNNIIFLGDINESLLYPNMHNLKDVLLLNSSPTVSYLNQHANLLC